MLRRGLFDIKEAAPTTLSLTEQRKRWLGQFFKPYLVLCVAYAAMYLLRYNFKAAQPLLVDQTGFTTTDLGNIGVAFSVAYGLSRVILGYFIDGKNTKRMLCALTFGSALISFLIGMYLWVGGSMLGFLLVLWGLNGVFQSPGGPCSNSTMNRWTPRSRRGRFIGWWNISHNVGGGLAGVLALFGANYFFGGHVAGMFIFPAVIAIGIAIWGFFYGKDDPKEIGWNSPEEIFDEPVPVTQEESLGLTKNQILVKYVLKNPAVWFLCLANLFVYMVRIGVDNWAPLYTTQHLSFSKEAAVTTLAFLEAGGFVGSMLWGYVSDRLGGRRALVGVFCMIGVIAPILVYNYATSYWAINIALFFEGLFIFGPVTLIGISIIGFAPKQATTVINAVPGTFGYVFGDSLAKVFIARIADPKSSGLDVFGVNLHGWEASFVVFYVAIALGIVFLSFAAVAEERLLRRDRAHALAAVGGE
ncbi:MAG: hexose-6-phosphate:phosphate antiporter [Propionibacteriaceae bacterium]|nr:hexose-6-phosphate:phosphate antiporter [Propionibacteriaceae bacterium]